MCDRTEVEGTGQTSNGRGMRDRPDDPLFPLLPRVLEVLRSRSAERVRTEGVGAAPASEYAALIESICGKTDDSQPVEQYDGTLGVQRAFVDSHQGAVGQIQWNDNLSAKYTNPGNVSGARWCSGTMISDDLFLTAGHCFDQTGGGWDRPRINGTSNIISSSDIAANMHVNFNYQVDSMGSPRPVSSFPITQLVEYRLGNLDFAVVRLGGNPGATWGRAQVSTTDAVAGEMLCIMGHPAGVPKRIEAGPALAPSGNQIRYDDIDTLGGNSGSGVLRANDGRIVGVHTNGGCGTGSTPNGVDANSGMRIAALIAASPTLQALTRPTLKHTDDVVATTRITDNITSIKVLDDHATVNKRVDDGVFSTKLLDDIAKRPLTDVIGTTKGLDDVKGPALDKTLGDNKLRGRDAPPLIDPRVILGGGRERPFALANPHHSMTWAGEAQAGAAAEAYEAALAQMGEAIVQQQQALVALDAEYRALLEEYQNVADPGQR